jgi:signal transduction histidine kinase/CheY-like chemotaxis protein
MLTIRLRSVRLKLLLMVLVINFFTLMVAGGALLYHDLKENQAKSVAQLTALADIIARGSTAALEFDDSKAAKENLMQLHANQNIVAAAIYNAHGDIFAQYGQVQQRASEIPGISLTDGFQFEAGELVVFKKIVSKSNSMGSVYIKERYELSAWFFDYIVILGTVLLGSLVVGQIISAQLHRWISDPILAVSSVARTVMEQRNYNLRATKNTEDEIGQLADAFNGMLQTLEHEIAERSGAELALRSLNAELERRVAERTSELQIANRALISRTDEAEKANRAKAEFLANMSHEIRTPMNGILGLAYLLNRRDLDPDSADMVSKIHNAGRSLQAIINDILDFSKIEAGRLEIEHAPFRLLDVYENLAGIIATTAGPKDIELVITPPPNISGQLYGDALRLEQVLINLVGNAIKFTESGVVKVGFGLVSQDEKIVTIRFSVTDSGIGISAENQEHIFTPFSQADESITRRFGGTGLGLTISRHLVTKMGGEIGVVSELGKGSEFWFTIPFGWLASTEFVPPQLSQLDVLIADDNDIASEAIATTTRLMGWNTTVVGSGEAAIDSVRSRREKNNTFDVLLIDWKMPGMDGVETATTIRESFEGESTPIVLMVTAYTKEELLNHPKIEYVDAVLSKPITCSMLYNCVAAALKRRGHDIGNGQSSSHKRYRQKIEGVRVLVVDDSEINREVASRILKDEGASFVRLENDGKNAVEWLRANPDAIDIVLMDIQMPVMDGYETTRQIRRETRFANLPIIALTAGAFKAQQDAAEKAGMNAFVAKPFNVDEMMGMIIRLTRGRSEGVNAEEIIDVPDNNYSYSNFKDLPGISLLKGLELWGDIEVYCKYLNKFSIEYADCCSRLGQFHRGGDRTSMNMLLHKLKGAAFNLSLNDVAIYVRELEVVVAGLGDPGTGIRQLQSALDTVFSSIALLVQNQTETVDQVSDVKNQKPLSELLDELLTALDTDTPNQANLILNSLAQLLPRTSIASLRMRLDDFDFRGAEAEVYRIATELEINLRKN